MTDYQQLYDQKSLEFDELNEQFLAYQCTAPCMHRIVGTHDRGN